MSSNSIQLSYLRLIALSWVSGLFGGLFVWRMMLMDPQYIALPAAVIREAARSLVPGSADAPAWGGLEVYDIEIEGPTELAAFDISPEPPRWVFEGASRADVRGWLEAAHVAAPQIERALSPPLFAVEPGRVVVHADDEIILSLSPDSRATLYGVLSQWPSNTHMHDPLRARPGDIQSWCTDSSITRDVATLIERLLYRQGDSECFSDYELVIRSLAAPQDRLNLIRKLSRQRTLLLRLRVEPTTDIDRFIGYWAVRGVRQKDLRPLAEGLKRLPGGGSMSITYALPPFARQRLYTFPMPALGDHRTEDCHWTTLNFFNDPPDERFADSSFISEYVKDNFYLISTATQYGDRVFLFDQGGQAIHSAVYLASDIVFTKNGAGATRPWILMHMQDLLDLYGGASRVTMLIYREKTA